MRYMIGKEIMKMIIAITKMIEARTANVEVSTEFDRVRLKDFNKHVESQDLNISSDPSSWPDDFEEDWE